MEYKYKRLEDKSFEKEYNSGAVHHSYRRLGVFLISLTGFYVFYMLGEISKWNSETTIKTNFKKTNDFLVKSASCQIPNINPWDESIKQFIKNATMPQCGSPRSRIRRIDNVHVLSVDDKGLDCCYAPITRTDYTWGTSVDKTDDIFTIGTCVKFKKYTTFSRDEQFIKITCKKEGVSKNSIHYKRPVYSNAHAFVRKTEAVEKKIKNRDENQERVSVMIFGIDSISRLNLFRTMPKAVEKMNNQGWINMEGYNKIDDNTFPNVMAILSGYSQKQLRSLCWPTNKVKLDRCPIIWKDFSDKGYITAYGEDEPYLGTFNVEKSGFVGTPTDYYLRPFMMAAWDLAFVKKDDMKVCIGSIPTVDIILDYTLDFIKTFQKDPFFALFWLNHFSHQDVNTPSTMDDCFVQFFEDLENSGALSNTIILFISDHGIRFGQIRETYVGWMEERLPFLYLWIPSFFAKKYPQKYENLKLNTNKLTSPYDLHVTLQELLGVEISGTKGCPKCQSLFKEVPINRSCDDAGITKHWCTCEEYINVSTESDIAKNISKLVLNKLESILNERKSNLEIGTRCANMTISKIISLRSKKFHWKIRRAHKQYVILLETLPGQARFEATVIENYGYKVIDPISRVNSYAGQSECMKDSFLQKYCYCQIEESKQIENFKVNY